MTQRVAQGGEYFRIGERSRCDRGDGELGLHLEQPLRHYFGLVNSAEVGQCSRAHPIRRAEPRVRLHRTVRRNGRFLEAAGYKMRDGNCHVPLIRQRIERAEPERQLGLLDGYRAFAVPGASESTKTERERRRVAEGQRSIERIESTLVVARLQKPDHKAGNRQRCCVVAPASNRQSRMSQRGGFGILAEPPTQVALLVTPSDDRMRDRVIGFESNRSFEE